MLVVFITRNFVFYYNCNTPTKPTISTVTIKMVKLITVCFLLLITIIAYVAGLSSSCPPSNKMTNCSPKCKDDHDCFGQKCCPNICNAKSCTAANQLTNADSGYKKGSSGATGTYCGNVKCNSYEKCELDRSTKREKCVRH